MPPSVIFWVALAESKQYHGLPLAQERQRPHGARQAMIDAVAGRHVGHALAHRLHLAGRLVAEEEREVVVDAAFAVVEVGVAHPAGQDAHERLAGAGVGDGDGLDGDRRLLGSGDHGADVVGHGPGTYSERAASTAGTQRERAASTARTNSSVDR